jgi:hypothetical protein
MSEDHSRTRAYEPGSNPIPEPGVTRPYTPGMAPTPPPNQPPPHGAPPYGQPPHDQPSYGQPPAGAPPYGQPPAGAQPFGQPPLGQPSYGQPPAGAPPYGQPSSYSPPYAAAQSGPGVAEERARAQRGLIFGVLWLVGGLLLSLITYSIASRSGGVYFVAYGPVIYGVIRIIVSLVALNKTKP